MTREAIIKAWKNEHYRHTLSISEQAALPAHPAGAVELDDVFLNEVSGAEDEESKPSWNAKCILVPTVTLSILIGTCGSATFGCCG